MLKLFSLLLLLPGLSFCQTAAGYVFYTGTGLAAQASALNGQTVPVRDSNNTCSGTGSYAVFCKSNGLTWSMVGYVGSGGGGGSTFTGAQFADQQGSTTTGIHLAVTACGTTTPCTVFVPSSYPKTEALPFAYSGTGSGQLYSGGGASYTVPSNVTIVDYRYGENRQAFDQQGAYPSGNFLPGFRDDCSVTAQNPVNSLFYMSKPCGSVHLNALSGGVNQSSNNFNNKGFYPAFNAELNKATRGQGVIAYLHGQSTGVGDYLGILNVGTCYGGYSSGGDEPCTGIDSYVGTGRVQASGTISSISGNTATLSFTVGDGTQGEGRYLVDSTSAITAGTVTSISGAPAVVTGSGTNWGTTSIDTTSSTAVAVPGVATVTLGSTTGITTSTVLVISDPYEYERVVPTAVTGSTITANFRRARLSGFRVTSGGSAGKIFRPNADTATPAVYNAYLGNYSLGSNIDYDIPVIASTPTTLTLWLSSPNSGFFPYSGQCCSSNNGYALYTGAEIVSVVQGDQLSNQLTLEVPSSFMSPGDGFILPHYYNQHTNAILMGSSQVLPRNPSGNPSSYYLTVGGQLMGATSTRNADAFMTMKAQVPPSLYANNSQWPDLIHPSGLFNSYLSVVQGETSPNAFLQDNNPASAPMLMQKSGGSGAGWLKADGANNRWEFGNYFNFANSAYIDFATGNYNGPTVQSRSMTYAQLNTLHACNSTNEGMRGGVNDSTVTTFGSTIAGGGSGHVPAYCNGSNWVVQ